MSRYALRAAAARKREVAGWLLGAIPVGCRRPASAERQVLVEVEPEHHILGVVLRAEDAVAVHLQLAPVGFGELAKRLLVTRARPRERGLD
ncbi:MAG TPA: hypothetical protein VI039_11670 [Solirubrobacterales bacterium]